MKNIRGQLLERAADALKEFETAAVAHNKSYGAIFDDIADPKEMLTRCYSSLDVIELNYAVEQIYNLAQACGNGEKAALGLVRCLQEGKMTISGLLGNLPGASGHEDGFYEKVCCTHDPEQKIAAAEEFWGNKPRRVTGITITPGDLRERISRKR